MTSNNYHCFICNLILYSKENIWIPEETYRELHLPTPSSGVYHLICAQEYLQEYLTPLTEKDKQKIMEGLDQRIKEVIGENRK